MKAFLLILLVFIVQNTNAQTDTGEQIYSCDANVTEVTPAVKEFRQFNLHRKRYEY